MKLCQGPLCHTYPTKDRIRGPKGDKHYETRKQTYYHDEFCCLRCQNDWFRKFGKLSVDHFGRIHEPKRTSASGAWYKHRNWRGYNNDEYYFINDLLGQRIPITEQQYDNTAIDNPTHLD